MSGEFYIALDAMGGDHAPKSVIAGANIARRRWPDIRFLLFGDEGRIAPLLKRMPRLQKLCSIRHTSDAVSNDEKPAVALRSGRQSSMRLAIDSVPDGRCRRAS